MARELPFLADHLPLADRSMATALAAVRRLAATVDGAPALSPTG
jgi:hypothetical protein